MSRAAGIVLALLLGCVVTDSAVAHRLKLFATAEGRTVSGYGFFVGGGRAAGTPIVARDGSGGELWRGATGDDGAFSFEVATPIGVTLTLDAGDGHAAELTLAADRFAPSPNPTPTPVQSPPTVAATPAVTTTERSAPQDDAALAARIGAAAAAEVAAEVDRAVARQIRPLLEASAAAEARIRLNDILGGLGWIAGLVGVGLTVAHRKRR